MERGARILLLIAFAVGCSEPEPVDARSVVLVTLDTTRADALLAFGGSRELAPTLETLARESIRFVQARTVAPLTLPSHASMFTGLYPPRHGVRNNGPASLSRDAETLAERAARANFQTAGFVGSLALDRAYGTAQGFEVWSQPTGRDDRVRGQICDRGAREVIADARAWLAQRDRTRPFLLWVHLFDPHAPYVAGPECVERAGGHPYWGEVVALDAELARLFDDLRREQFLERGTVCVAGDHGEALGEHGEDTHGHHVWDSTLRVPLFVRLKGGSDARDDARIASVVDVAPTLAQAMRLSPFSGIDGRSLLDAPSEGRGVYFESLAGWARFRWSPLCGWASDEGKYVHSTSPRFTLSDEDERRDVDSLTSRAAEAQRARAALRAVLSAPRLAADGLAPSESGALALAALGYGDRGELEPEYPDPLEASSLPSPDASLDEYRAFSAAIALAATARHELAVERLEELLERNPRSVSALDELAASLIALERWQRAVEVLLERREHSPERLSTEQGLVQCYTSLGDARGARVHALRALELLVEIHRRRGELERAANFQALLDAERGR
ncbi:MAG: hypothetical protein FJ298_03745 [Planctomycetes bacterium]|nr:hypothetical protein [Planctomycetota bacterium]